VGTARRRGHAQLCTKTILHPEVGPLALASEVLLDSTGEQSLVLYTAQPGTDTAEKLELLRVLGREKFAELREVR
jgi:MmyB-like transcription regulator ligand binding domain